jgi:mono/diheme cytochrome c family protein
MRRFLSAAGFCVLGSGVAFGAELILGDAQRGAELLRTEKCLSCHSMRGDGGTSAPDLGRMTGRNYTPSWMASIMWNHAPTMWAAMEKQGIPKPRLTEAQAADLFAYFQSVRFFERPGDAARGKQVFTSKHCADCHGISSQVSGGGPPVATWQSLAAPIMLAQEMWNHASQMQAAMRTRRIRWPELTGQDLTDLLVYVQNLPQTRGRVQEFALGPAGHGESLFKEKGCGTCHVGKLAIGNHPTNGTLTDFAVSMWEHAPKMWDYQRKTGTAPPRLERDEMRQIVAYLWYKQLFAERASPEHGRQVFEKKNCGVCHNDPSSGAPDLKKILSARNAPLRPFSMASVLWLHGPTMLEKLNQSNRPWPRFARSEMADLTAYLNSPEFASSETPKSR